MNNCKIVYRDTNGKTFITNGNQSEMYKLALVMSELDYYEILLVIAENVCIYSELNNQEIDWEDLVGFFA